MQIIPGAHGGNEYAHVQHVDLDPDTRLDLFGASDNEHSFSYHLNQSTQNHFVLPTRTNDQQWGSDFSFYAEFNADNTRVVYTMTVGGEEWREWTKVAQPTLTSSYRPSLLFTGHHKAGSSMGFEDGSQVFAVVHKVLVTNELGETVRDIFRFVWTSEFVPHFSPDEFVYLGLGVHMNPAWSGDLSRNRSRIFAKVPLPPTGTRVSLNHTHFHSNSVDTNLNELDITFTHSDGSIADFRNHEVSMVLHIQHDDT